MKSFNLFKNSVKPSFRGAQRRGIPLLKLAMPLMLAASLLLCASAYAQQAKSQDSALLQSYSAGREVSLVGTVVKYDSDAITAPPGAHLIVQTPSGQVDVHLGNGKLLEAANLTLNPGDNVRIVGEPMALGNGGTFFAARIVQKGTQAVAFRNSRGALVRFAPLTPAQKEALRGVR